MIALLDRLGCLRGWLSGWLALGIALGCAAACGGRPGQPGRGALAGGPVLHLADHLAEAAVRSAGAPAAARQGRAWSFDAPRPEWRTVSSADEPRLAAVDLSPAAGGVRLALSRSPSTGLTLVGGIAVDLGVLRFDDWDTVLVRARSRDRLAGITVAYNLDEEGAVPGEVVFYTGGPTAPPVFSDGSAQTYAIPLQPREGAARPATLRSLGVFVGASAPASLDILAVSLVPRGAAFVDPYGARPVTRDGVTRHTLFAHTPAAISWRLPVPAGARLDLGLSAISGEAVSYRITAGAGGGERKTLLAETVHHATPWGQRSVDLSAWGGSIVELTLTATSERPGSVALWGAPIVSGKDRSGQRGQRPNVIFYVIDGGGADLMSVYGYNRRTTPFLERLAGEGVVFERAYSSSTWTQPSTASFMTSLHHSVLGGLRRGVHSTPVPAAATTMAEHLRRAGYQTAVFTSNPNAGRVIGLERGVDWMEDEETGHLSTSSVELHERFWNFRELSPAAPYWVHFQTTDVHEPHEPVQPFAGLFVSPEERARLRAWDERIIEAALPLFGTTSIPELYDRVLERTGIDRQAYFGLLRGLYDETMAHQDHQLGRLVERLKRQGEWEDTLLVITADHGHPAGTFTRFGRGLFDPQPEPWQGALFDSYNTRVPLIFVWPGRIAGGRRFDRPVSTIDVLPTLLDLLGLPPPEVLQGQSLAPLLLGRESRLRPVILDEFRVDESGELVGNLEIVDGRWGASLEIGPHPQGPAAVKGRHAVPAGGRWGAVHPYFPDAPRLLLYDLWTDPFALRTVNDRHPELVERYRRMLLRQWRAHLALAERFREAGEVALTPEQLRQLRALGYIQ